MHLLSEPEGRETTSRLCFMHFHLAFWFPGMETDHCRISPFGHTELTAMICLSYHQTIASQCAIPHNAQSGLLESAKH